MHVTLTEKKNLPTLTDKKNFPFLRAAREHSCDRPPRTAVGPSNLTRQEARRIVTERIG